MGIGFTLDTPLRVAKLGISSCMSLVDDVLIEQVRAHYCKVWDRPFDPVPKHAPEARAKRITAYLNLVEERVRLDWEAMRHSALDDPDGLGRYFALLPEGELRDKYRAYQSSQDETTRTGLERELRERAAPGAVDVNIMTKVDRRLGPRGEERSNVESDALAALRGFAQSRLRSAVVLSAGLNPRLSSELSSHSDFFPVNGELPQKRVILKVSDFRSALVQARMLARSGILPSEYRIESGLNCGGHAFASRGTLLGPILEEFKVRRSELGVALRTSLAKGLSARGLTCPDFPEPRVTVQGGIGTADEDRMLRRRFAVDGTGWGTPFLFVPEVVTLTEDTLERLETATERDIQLTRASPLGVEFWSLLTSGSEQAREARIRRGIPGSACPKGYLAVPTEFGSIPLCPASRTYQKLKLASLERSPSQDLEAQKERALRFCCICHDLSGDLRLALGVGKRETPAICPGPNGAHFDRRMTLEQLVDHIYGRGNVIVRSRNHMFINELHLYIDHYERRTHEVVPAGSDSKPALDAFRADLEQSIAYYLDLAPRISPELGTDFVAQVRAAATRLSRVARAACGEGKAATASPPDADGSAR